MTLQKKITFPQDQNGYLSYIVLGCNTVYNISFYIYTPKSALIRELSQPTWRYCIVVEYRVPPPLYKKSKSGTTFTSYRGAPVERPCNHFIVQCRL